MVEVAFRYKDRFTHGGWSTQSCRMESVEACKKWYGLGVDCEYEITAVRDERGRVFTVGQKIYADENGPLDYPGHYFVISSLDGDGRLYDLVAKDEAGTKFYLDFEDVKTEP